MLLLQSVEDRYVVPGQLPDSDDGRVMPLLTYVGHVIMPGAQVPLLAAREAD